MYRVLSNDLGFLLHSDAHTGVVNDLAFGPTDSISFVSIDNNGTLKAWDLSEYKPIFTGYPQRAT